MHDNTSKWDAWARRLASLVERARAQDQVLGQPLEEGVELLVYPVAGAHEVLVGLGLSAARAERCDTGALLRRRGQRMCDAGHWLPARFEDGSLFLLRHWPADHEAEWPGGVAQALRHAGELLDA